MTGTLKNVSEAILYDAAEFRCDGSWIERVYAVNFAPESSLVSVSESSRGLTEDTTAVEVRSRL